MHFGEWLQRLRETSDTEGNRLGDNSRVAAHFFTIFCNLRQTKFHWTKDQPIVDIPSGRHHLWNSAPMLIKRLVSSFVPSLGFSSLAGPRILKSGDILRQTRIFSELDVLEYAKVSHDSNPLHFDSKCAQDAGFGAQLVHGMLVAALFPRIISSHFPGAIYVSQSLNFKLPVYIGDEIVGEVQATNIKENKKRYVAKFATKCFKSSGVIVIDGEAMAVLPTLAVEEGSM